MDLENYFQNLNVETKNLIEQNQLWYLGDVNIGTSYKKSICATVDDNISAGICERTTSVAASIGLPRAGEMFTSQITRGTKAVFWTLTKLYKEIRDVSANGYFNASPATQGLGARPSMYLKSNVVISSTNTGDGTYEHPYDIELGR